MGMKTSLTREAVFPVIGKLVASGVYPSIALVRAELGHRGSAPVLQRFLQEWHATYGPMLVHHRPWPNAQAYLESREATLKKRELSLLKLESLQREAVCQLHALAMQSSKALKECDSSKLAVQQRLINLIDRLELISSVTSQIVQSPSNLVDS